MCSEFSWKANVQFWKYREISKQSVFRFLIKKQKVLTNTETNCLFLSMQPVITHQYEHTYHIIHSERSHDNERQKEILEMSKNESWNFYGFGLNYGSRHNDTTYNCLRSAKNKIHKQCIHFCNKAILIERYKKITCKLFFLSQDLIHNVWFKSICKVLKIFSPEQIYIRKFQ